MAKFKKRGQEEAVGFLVIVVLVTIALVILLGILIKGGGGEKKESRDVYYFLESSMEYTADCEVRFAGDYSTLGQLFRDCRTGMVCLNGKGSCEVLKETMGEIINLSWKVGANNPVKGYEFRSYYTTGTNGSQESEILLLKEGECSGNKRGSSYLVPASPGRIVNVFKICY